MGSADEKLKRVILSKMSQARDASEAMRHLSRCDEVSVAEASGQDVWCDFSTCSHLELSARLSCPHGHSAEFEYEDGGTLADLFEEMDCA